MSWHFSQALEAAFSEASCWDGQPSARSSASPRPGECSSPARTTDASTHSRSGTTCGPSTDDPGVGWWISSLADSRVRTSARPERARALKASGRDSGETWQGSFAKWDRASCSWKTHQFSLLGGLESFSATWPRWGMMRDGACWERSMPALRTSESESGLWATPTASTGGPEPEGKTGRKLVTRVKMWPTVTVCGNYNRKGASAKSGDGLATAVATCPTPRSRDWKDTGTVPPSRMIDPGKDSLGQWVARTEPGGSLNPTWVEWLMGWPLGWTDSAHSGTDKFRQWLRSHGKSSDPTGSSPTPDPVWSR
jgi:hypothetical protein